MVKYVIKGEVRKYPEINSFEDFVKFARDLGLTEKDISEDALQVAYDIAMIGLTDIHASALALIYTAEEQKLLQKVDFTTREDYEALLQEHGVQLTKETLDFTWDFFEAGIAPKQALIHSMMMVVFDRDRRKAVALGDADIR